MPSNKIDSKLVTAPDGHIITRMWRMRSGPPVICSGCGRTIDAGDYIQGCMYCDYMFCEACITGGIFERHRNKCDDQYWAAHKDDEDD